MIASIPIRWEAYSKDVLSINLRRPGMHPVCDLLSLARRGEDSTRIRAQQGCPRCANLVVPGFIDLACAPAGSQDAAECVACGSTACGERSDCLGDAKHRPVQSGLGGTELNSSLISW